MIAMERQQQRQWEENKKRKIQVKVKKVTRIWQLLEVCLKGSGSNIDKNRNWHRIVKYFEGSWQK